ncbi:MAG TPA: phosphatidate cytidylyltransferase [Candidatus Dormibacteraeota bacterium]|nr:phosphatidate cytidylyltransferase [Candidatus Dormibacteraeota bacterium]
MSLSPLMVRILSGAVVLVVCLGAIFLGVYGVVGLCVLLTALMLWEFRGLSDKMGSRAPSWLLYPLGSYITFSGTFLRGISLQLILSIALVGGLLVFLFLPGRREGLGRWAMGMAGALYIGLPMNCYLLLYFSGHGGLGWVVFVILAAALTDVLALLVGSRLGRTPFFRRISPHKTVEGAVAGLIGAVLVMVFGSLVTLGLPLQHAVAIGILVGIGAEGGDLVESQMKRIGGVKDSSSLIPGHGGALDRFDSILFPAILVFYYASFGGLLR